MISQNVESYKILIVSSSPLLEDYVQAFQSDGDKKFPFNVHAISSQTVARELFERIKFDIVILEYKLTAEGNILELLDWIKEKSPKTMVIILSSDENIIDREKAFELGTFDWVVTGDREQVNVDQVIRRVKDALLYRRFEEGIFELKKDYKPIVVDVLDGHVHEIEGDVVYAKYLINGEEHKAVFDIDLFKSVSADFQGAKVRFLTVKTDDESNPYDLRIELKEEQELNEITGNVQEKLDRLELFDNRKEVK